MRKIFFLAAIAVILSGCNTMRGLGKDLGTLGHKIQNIGGSQSADDAE